MEPPAAKERVLVYRRTKPTPNNSLLLHLPPALTSPTTAASFVPAQHMSDDAIAQSHELPGNAPSSAPNALPASAFPGPAFPSTTTAQQTELDFYRLLDQLLRESSQLAAARRNEFFRREAEIAAATSHPGLPSPHHPAASSTIGIGAIGTSTALSTSAGSSCSLPATALSSTPPPTTAAQRRVAAFIQQDQHAQAEQWRAIALRINDFVEQNMADPAERRRVLAEALRRCRDQTARDEVDKFNRAVLNVHDVSTPVEGMTFDSWREHVAWNASRCFVDPKERSRFMTWDIEQIKKGPK